MYQRAKRKHLRETDIVIGNNELLEHMTRSSGGEGAVRQRKRNRYILRSG